MKKRAKPDFSAARGLFTVPRLSHGLKRGQRLSPRPCFLTGPSAARTFHSNQAFSREQARLAPRAHVRELLCGTQSSKERLRRSRTESSAAPPAIEELAGEARQVRPARAACGFVSTDFGFLTGGEVRRAPGPPAPATNLSPQRPNMPPSSCSRTTKAGSFPPGTISVVSRPFITIMLFYKYKRCQCLPHQLCFLTGPSAVSISPGTRPSHGHKRGQRRERM